jgi:hemin uptake protein HemP
MAHNGNEYEIKITYEDGTEELSGWMNSTDQLAHAMAAVHRSQGKAYWLRVRREDQIILECPITDMPTPRYSTHDSCYLVKLRSRDRYASGF